MTARDKGLNDYTTLGRSGLLVSPLCLGTMTFGNEWGWGSEEDTARAVFDQFSHTWILILVCRE